MESSEELSVIFDLRNNSDQPQTDKIIGLMSAYLLNNAEHRFTKASTFCE